MTKCFVCEKDIDKKSPLVMYYYYPLTLVFKWMHIKCYKDLCVKKCDYLIKLAKETEKADEKAATH